MGQYVEGPCRSDVAAGAISQFLRVKTPGALAVAGASDLSVGTMEKPALAAGPATVRLRNSAGTRKMVASEAITANAYAYAAAGGKVAASGTIIEGIAMEASSANNDVIEILPLPVVPDAIAKGAMTITPAADNGAGSTIPANVTQVVLAANTNDANDWFNLPPIADVPIGHQIIIAVNGGANCEMRTPATSGTTINNEDCDGTKEYLCTSTDTIIVTKRSTTGWIGQSLTVLGAVRTAVVPD